MMDVKIVDLSMKDLSIMAQNIRPMDALEYRAMYKGTPIDEGMKMTLDHSNIGKAAYIDGELLCCWGRCDLPILTGECNPWMVATSLVESRQAQRAFIKQSKKVTRDLVGGFSRAWNLVYEKNHQTIRWLKWVGFEFIGEAEDVNGYKFLPFEYRKG